MVQVLHTDHGKFETYSSCFDKVKVVCLTVIDGNGNRLLARVAAHLSDMAVHLQEGHILCLKMFNDLFMKPNKHSPPTAIIVIVQTDMLGSGPILMDEVNTQMLTINEMPVGTHGTTDTDTTDNVSEEFDPPPQPEQPCTYDHCLCLVYRL